MYSDGKLIDGPVPLNRNGEYRSAARYPVKSHLLYTLVSSGKEFRSGRGRTVNVSATGLLFESADSFSPGDQIELTVDWPGRPGDIRLQLCAFGEVVRSGGRSVAVKIHRYHFITEANQCLDYASRA